LTPSRPIRLAYLVSQYPAVNHTFILREIRALRDLGFEIHVVSIRVADRPPEKLSEVEMDEYNRTWSVLAAGAGTVLRVHAGTFLRRPVAYLRGLAESIGLARGDVRKVVSNAIYFGEAVVAGHRIESLGLRHVHTHFSSTVALLLGRVFPLTFSATIHGPDEFNDVAGFHIAEKVARSRFLCAISAYGRSQLMKASDPRYWEKLDVVPLGVDCNAFTPRPHRAAPDRFEILCVGRLAPAKAQHILLKVIYRLVHEGRNVHLRLVGEGPDRPSLEKKIVAMGLQSQVTLEGACNQDRVLSFYRQTDLFALASFAEGVPVVLMEAMAMEIPCVATWITGIPELIRHGIDGWLVPPADEEQLASAIAALMDDGELRQRLGKAARLRVIDKYDLLTNAGTLAETFRRRLA